MGLSEGDHKGLIRPRAWDHSRSGLLGSVLDRRRVKSSHMGKGIEIKATFRGISEGQDMKRIYLVGY